MKEFTYSEFYVERALHNTEVFLKFCNERDYTGSSGLNNLEKCLENLKEGHVKKAIANSCDLPLGGMGTFLDGFVEVVYPHENHTYMNVIFDALLDRWKGSMEYLEMEKEERTKRESRIIIEREARHNRIMEKSRSHNKP